MTPEQFAYWLQGFVEMTPTENVPTPQQWTMIKQHLQTVFTKVTPDLGKTEMLNLKDVFKKMPRNNPLDGAIC